MTIIHGLQSEQTLSRIAALDAACNVLIDARSRVHAAHAPIQTEPVAARVLDASDTLVDAIRAIRTVISDLERV